jgi:hypothetical protein
MQLARQPLNHSPHVGAVTERFYWGREKVQEVQTDMNGKSMAAISLSV